MLAHIDTQDSFLWLDHSQIADPQDHHTNLCYNTSTQKNICMVLFGNIVVLFGDKNIDLMPKTGDFLK